MDYLDSAWWYDDSAIVGRIFVATAGAGRRLELLIEALEGSAILLCDAILGSPRQGERCLLDAATAPQGAPSRAPAGRSPSA